MFFHLLLHEWRLLWRSRTFTVLSLLFLALLAAACWQSHRYVAQQQAALSELRAEQQQTFRATLATLQAIERDPAHASPYSNPQVPFELGRGAATQHVYKWPAPLALLSRGQSEHFAHSYAVSLGNPQPFAALLSDDNLAHPLHQLIGLLDPAFVLVWLLPFWVLGACFDLISREREQGTWPLIISQALSAWQWLSVKAGLRWLLISALSSGFLLVALEISAGPGVSGGEKGVIAASIAAYAGFWVLLAAGINALQRSSSVNAGLLFACWVALVLVLPAGLSLAAEKAFPQMSRLNLVNSLREQDATLSRNIEQEMNTFYLDHPELAPADDANKMPYWHYQLALRQRKAAAMAAPLVQQYQARQQARLNWLARYRWLSPAIWLQARLDRLAQTTTGDFVALQQQADAANETYREVFFPKIFRDEYMTAQDFARLPDFGGTGTGAGPASAFSAR